MEWIERMNCAVNYIEEHITDEISYEELGKVACCSSYHFQRMFTYMAEIPLSEYIRRRRMSLAAVDLRDPEAKIIDIALKYGYNSPTAFNRAFQGIHGLAPSVVRNEGASVKAYPSITFQMVVKGVEQLDYQIVNKDAFRIIGLSVPLYQEVKQNLETVPMLWKRMGMDGTLANLAGKMNQEPFGLLGVSMCNDEEQWKYYIAVSSTLPIQNEEFEENLVSAQTWAVFHGNGNTCSVQKMEERIISEWLPTSGYEYANAPDVEVYPNPDPAHSDYEVWIPVVKKIMKIM